MNKGLQFLMWSLLLAGGIFGCSQQPAAGPTGTPNQSVVENPQTKDTNTNPSSTKSDPKDPPGNPPTVEPKAKDAHQASHSFTLNPQGTGAVQGNVHVHFLNPIFSADHEPFFVVWTDAAGYSAATFYQNDNQPRRSDTGETKLEYGKDRVVKFSFEITVAEKGRFKIDGKTYDFAKGALFLVAGKDGDVRVKLLNRSKLPRDFNEVIAFGKADPDINAFFPDLKKMPFFAEAPKSK